MSRQYSSDNPHPVDLYVGSRLKRRRIENELSQQSLAALIGRTFQQLQKYESGANRISASMLYDLGRALHVAPGYFYDGYNQADPPPSQPDHLPVPASWLRLYHDLPKEARRAIITMGRHIPKDKT